MVDLGDSVLIPGLVNAHTHLDLTHIGPRPFDPNDEFRRWLDMVLSERRHDPQGIAESVLLGAKLSESGGVVAVGDIAGIARREAMHALRTTRLLGISFLEFFGMGRRQEATIAAMISAIADDQPHPRIRLGLQPHAPYSAGLRVFDAVTRLGIPLSTHLAESQAEHEFISRGTGAMRGLLERLNAWDETVLDEVGRGETPVQHLAPFLNAAPFLVAHCNDCSDADIQRLAASKATVVYCSRSSSYFGHHLRFGPHRYRDMLAAGVRVILGTDSIINTPLAHADRLTPLDDARLLHTRDNTPADLLLRMMTTDSAIALGLEAGGFRFPRRAEGIMAGVACVNVSKTDRDLPPLDRVMRSTTPAPLLHAD